jgi:hypothetical protein
MFGLTHDIVLHRIDLVNGALLGMIREILLATTGDSSRVDTENGSGCVCSRSRMRQRLRTR